MQVGGPNWNVLLGRKDSRRAIGNTGDLPGADLSLTNLAKKFSNKKLSLQDMTALSGAHTIGRSQCQNFRSHIYNDRNINASFVTQRKQACPPQGRGGDGNLVSFDVRTADQFDNAYYKNLVERRGLLHSDQELFNGATQDALVRTYSTNQARFFSDFATAMVKMGNLMPSGTTTEVRLNCRRAN